MLTDLPHTWTFVPYDTKSQVCDVGIPSVFRQLEVPCVQLVQFSCPRALHAPRPEMVSDKEYSKVQTIQQHVLSFICLVERFFFLKDPGYLSIVLVYGHKLDHGGFPV